MQRVLRYDGILPNVMAPDGSHAEATPDDIRAIVTYVAERRTETTPFDIVWEGQTPGDDPTQAAALVRPWAAAGATWWMEANWEFPVQIEGIRTRIQQGPPRID